MCVVCGRPVRRPGHLVQYRSSSALRV
jgi:hypothetical protein